MVSRISWATAAGLLEGPTGTWWRTDQVVVIATVVSVLALLISLCALYYSHRQVQIAARDQLIGVSR